MKYMKQGFALLMVLPIVLTIMPVRAENFSGEGQLAADGSLSGEGDKSSVSGDTVSSPNGGEKELKKLTVEKKNAVEMAANGIDGAQPYAAGDGNIASGKDGDISWVIDGNGKLIVTGSGNTNISSISNRPWTTGEYRTQIISAEINVTDMTNMAYMFSGCSSLKSVNLNGLNTDNVTDMSGMFYGCTALEKIDLSGLNTSNVKRVCSMFEDCANLKSIVFGEFDTSSVTTMMGMFWGCKSLENVNLNRFDTGNVTDMSYMFAGCDCFEYIDLNAFDTSRVRTMAGMFAGCDRLKSIDINVLDTSSVRDMGGMFSDCGSLEYIDLSGLNTSNVTDMGWMFERCYNLKNINLNNIETSNVTELGGMFSECSNLKNIDISNFNTGNVTNLSRMFEKCSSIESLDLRSFDISNVTDMLYVFLDCSSLKKVDLSDLNAINVTRTQGMFLGCDNLIVIYAPYNLSQSVPLPLTEVTDTWRLPDDTEITELPQNRTDSVIITRYRNPKIITETRDLNMSDVIRVKYVPYSYTVETNNWDPDNIVTYSIEKGTLARGLQMYPATGEIYGMPLEAGEFPITVKATFSNPRYLPSYKDLTLTVLDNTDSNVWNASDLGYEVEQYVGTLVSGSCPVLTELTDQLFVSTGAYREFIDFWLNGEKLVEGKDYTKEEGSTRITIRSQTFKEKADKNGVNTIAAEFRVGGDTGNALKRTAQNFRIKEQANNNSGGTSDTSGSSGSGSRGNAQHTGNIVPSPALQATAVVRLSTPSGAPLSGILLELHSAPMEAVTDANGAAIFNGVEGGWHTLYVKDANGTVLASKGFELLFGERESMEGDRITAKAGEPFTLAVQMEGDKLTFVSFAETVAVQENKTPQTMQMWSANTGDAARPGLWFTLFVSFGALMGIFLYGEQKKHMIKK